MATESIANEGSVEGGEITYRVVSRHDSRKCRVVFDLIETRDGLDSRVGWFEHISTAYVCKWAMEELV